MGVFRTVLNIATKEEGDIIDLTGKVSETVKDSGFRAGIACVFVPHTTAAVFITENEPGLRSDIVRSMEKVFPKGFGYAHNTDGDGNGHSHIRALTLGQSVVVPFNDASLDIGTWQSIVLMELDNGGRPRKLIIQLVGE
jgi:secondary thiamine-phosphate synthase enzyme